MTACFGLSTIGSPVGLFSNWWWLGIPFSILKGRLGGLSACLLPGHRQAGTPILWSGSNQKSKIVNRHLPAAEHRQAGSTFKRSRSLSLPAAGRLERKRKIGERILEIRLSYEAGSGVFLASACLPMPRQQAGTPILWLVSPPAPCKAKNLCNPIIRVICDSDDERDLIEPACSRQARASANSA